MTFECVCDYDPSDVWEESKPVARVRHRCTECGGPILPGERYDRVASLYDGAWSHYKTCPRCMAIVAYVKAHVPCFCWYREGLFEDGGARDTLERYAHEAPGLMFGYGRLLVALRRFKTANKGKIA